MNPEKFGACTWITMEGFVSLKHFKGSIAKQTIYLWTLLLMCHDCSSSFMEYLSRVRPLKRRWTASSKKMKEWLVLSHHDVSQRLGKKQTRKPFQIKIGSEEWTDQFFQYLYYLFGHYQPAQKQFYSALLNRFLWLLSTERKTKKLALQLHGTFSNSHDSKNTSSPDSDIWSTSITLIKALARLESKRTAQDFQSVLRTRMNMVKDALLFPQNNTNQVTTHPTLFPLESSFHRAAKLRHVPRKTIAGPLPIIAPPPERNCRCNG